MLKSTPFSARRLAPLGLLGCLVSLSCQSGPSTSSSSHWLKCQTDEDCRVWREDSLCGPDQFCELKDGIRLTRKLVLDADFTAELDPDVFAFEEGFSIRNGDAEYYTNRPENVRVEDGHLILTARAETYMEAEYTSGSVTTSGLFSFTYGRIEADIWAPDGAGTGPAFWLLPESPGPAELYCMAIDECVEATWPVWGDMIVMTTRSETPSQVIQTTNFGRYEENWSAVVRNEAGTTVDLGESVASGFHEYALEWSPGRLEWFIDGESTAIADTTAAYRPGGVDVYSRPFHIKLNLAVGGLAETPEPSAYPQEMRIASLRVLRYE